MQDTTKIYKQPQKTWNSLEEKKDENEGVGLVRRLRG